jgi:hypothetical protein
MLDAHSELAIVPESHFIPALISACEEGASPERLVRLLVAHRRWPDLGIDADELLERLRALDRLEPGGVVRAAFALYAERRGKPRWGDATPRYIRKMSWIQPLLPEARFIHLIRDVRDVALAVTDGPPEPERITRIAHRWRKKILRAREAAPELARYVEVRYEELADDPEATLRRICDFLELPWEPPIAGAVDLEPSGRWRTEMGDAERAACEEIAGDLIAELGYEAGAPVAGPAPARS